MVIFNRALQAYFSQPCSVKRRLLVGRVEEIQLQPTFRLYHLNVVKLLPDKGTEIAAANNKSLMPLHSASLSGHLEVVKLLLKNGAAPMIANEGVATPLTTAAPRGYLKLASLPRGLNRMS